jgi:hypothetical protein
MSTEKDAPKSVESRELSADEEEKISVLKQLSKIIEEREERQTINLEDFEKCLDVFVRLYRNNEAAIRFSPSQGGFLLFATPPSEILKKEVIDNNIFRKVMFDVIQMAGNIFLNREEDFIERYCKRENVVPEIVSKKLELVREQLVDANLIESFGVAATSKLKLFQNVQWDIINRWYEPRNHNIVSAVLDFQILNPTIEGITSLEERFEHLVMEFSLLEIELLISELERIKKEIIEMRGRYESK